MSDYHIIRNLELVYKKIQSFGCMNHNKEANFFEINGIDITCTDHSQTIKYSNTTRDRLLFLSCMNDHFYLDITPDTAFYELSIETNICNDIQNMTDIEICLRYGREYQDHNLFSNFYNIEKIKNAFDKILVS